MKLWRGACQMVALYGVAITVMLFVVMLTLVMLAFRTHDAVLGALYLALVLMAVAAFDDVDDDWPDAVHIDSAALLEQADRNTARAAPLRNAHLATMTFNAALGQNRDGREL